jgi:hypothetical protein
VDKLKSFLVLHQRIRGLEFITFLGLKMIEEGASPEELGEAIDQTKEAYQNLNFCRPVWREIQFLKDMRKQLE